MVILEKYVHEQTTVKTHDRAKGKAYIIFSGLLKCINFNPFFF